MPSEATITINGYTLTQSQAMTLRKATEAFLFEMRSPDILGTDELGRNLASGFVRRCEQILSLLDAPEPTQTPAGSSTWTPHVVLNAP